MLPRDLSFSISRMLVSSHNKRSILFIGSLIAAITSIGTLHPPETYRFVLPAESGRSNVEDDSRPARGSAKRRTARGNCRKFTSGGREERVAAGPAGQR